MSEKKRKFNFSASEIDLLVTLVTNYKSVIEYKRSDAVTTGKKEAAWKKVEEEFNSQSESSLFRNEQALKKKYNNLKADLKKKSATEKQSVYATGGGPPSTKLTDNEDRLLSILHEKQIHGMKSHYDCDVVIHTNTSTEAPGTSKLPTDDNEEVEIEWLEDDMVHSSEPVNKSGVEAKEDTFEQWDNDKNVETVEAKGDGSEQWNKYDAGMLRQPKSVQLRARRRANSNTNAQSSWSKLAEVKAKWTEEKLRVEIGLLKEEHQKMDEKAKLERELMREKHEIELQVLRRKLE